MSVGGPIRTNKLFFFAHYEGIRIALPMVSQAVVPSPAYQQYVLGQLPTGGTDPITGTVLPPQPGEVPFYRSMFALYRNTSGTPASHQHLPTRCERERCYPHLQAAASWMAAGAQISARNR